MLDLRYHLRAITMGRKRPLERFEESGIILCPRVSERVEASDRRLTIDAARNHVERHLLAVQPIQLVDCDQSFAMLLAWESRPFQDGREKTTVVQPHDEV